MAEDADDYDLPRYKTRTSSRLWLELSPGIKYEIGGALRFCTPNNAAVKSRLALIADQHGLFCHLTGEAGRKELLYDVVWTDKKDDFLEVYLICEIEIGRSKKLIIEDFRKLLLGKSPIKVMVFALGDPSHHKTTIIGDDLRDEMKELINGFHLTEPGEIYILVELGPSPQFETHCVTHEDIYGSIDHCW
jgi:hypothetical protein